MNIDIFWQLSGNLFGTIYIEEEVLSKPSSWNISIRCEINKLFTDQDKINCYRITDDTKNISSNMPIEIFNENITLPNILFIYIEKLYIHEFYNVIHECNININGFIMNNNLLYNVLLYNKYAILRIIKESCSIRQNTTNDTIINFINNVIEIYHNDSMILSEILMNFPLFVNKNNYVDYFCIDEILHIIILKIGFGHINLILPYLKKDFVKSLRNNDKFILNLIKINIQNTFCSIKSYRHRVDYGDIIDSINKDYIYDYLRITPFLYNQIKHKLFNSDIKNIEEIDHIELYKKLKYDKKLIDVYLFKRHNLYLNGLNYFYDFLSDRLKEDKVFLKKCIIEYPKLFSYLPSKFKSDVDFILYIFDNNYENDYIYTNLDIVMQYVDKKIITEDLMNKLKNINDFFNTVNYLE